jgi:FHA domain
MSFANDDEPDIDGPYIEHDPTVFFDPNEPSGAGQTAPEVAGAFGYALRFERGPRAGMTYILGDGTTDVGRSEDAGLFLGDVSVSRRHATFEVADGVLSVQDLGSLNGTYVNGSRVEQAELSPGDEVWIGKFHFIVAVGHG